MPETLTRTEEISLAREIEAGLIAAAVTNGDWPDPGATPDELSELIRRGELAWERLWLANLGLVHHLARAAARRTGLPLDDLVSEAQLGLAEAMRRWDCDRGSKFSTTAWIWISNRLHHGVRTLRRARAELASDDPHDVFDRTPAVPREHSMSQLDWWHGLTAADQRVLALLADPATTMSSLAATLGLSRRGCRQRCQQARDAAAEARAAAAA